MRGRDAESGAHRWLSASVLAMACSCGGLAVTSASGAGAAGEGGSADPALACERGLGDCNSALEDGCETDLESDDGSCGACGHGCQGGHCQSGVCQAVIVASGQAYAYRLAATETHVYWTSSDGRVLRAADGSEPEAIASGMNAPGDIAVDDASVYWANVGDGTIVRAPQGGGAITVLATGSVQPWSLAVSGDALVWTDHGSGDVRVLSLSGGEPVTIATTPGAWSVAVDTGYAYWSTLFEGRVLRAPLGGGDAVPVVSGVSSPSDLAIHGDRLYFGTASDAGVFSVPLAGGEVTALVTRGGFGIAADAAHVYFGEYDGRVARVPLGGGSETVLGKGPATPTDIALTTTRVYWTAAGGEGVIMMVAK